MSNKQTTKLTLWLEEEDSPMGTLLLNGEEVADISTELGETIVKCVNSHEQLVKALKKARTIIWNTKYHDDIEWGSTLKEASEFADECHEIVEIDEILALVEGVFND